MNKEQRALLLDMVIYKVIELREPAYKQLPFKINLDAMETKPEVRGHVMKSLMARWISVQPDDAVALVPKGCRGLVPILADRLGVAYLLPIELAPDDDSPVCLYGSAKKHSNVLLICEYLRQCPPDEASFHPLVKMLNVLVSQRFDLEKVIVIFDADRDRVVSNHLNRNRFANLQIEVIFDMREVLSDFMANAGFYGLDQDLAARALRHYQSKASILPPSVKTG
ncbi:MAG: hypothetical protein ACOYUZ_03640 [Patescibacteria group bacterium]